MKYIAKANTWFDEGTEVEYICPMLVGHKWPAIMSGIRNGKPDEEGCSEHEFEAVEQHDTNQCF